ncbi:MAG: hypothetical protein M1826_003415 [Phylliscum demangeonii]|nr:MAG: hypothetical protein M1826_003415 [Phylliscum demangeonii]
MKLLSLLAICHLTSVIGLATPILGTPLKTSSSSTLNARTAPPEAPRNPIYKSLSPEDYAFIVKPMSESGIVVTLKQVQRINKIQSVYDKFRGPAHGIQHALTGAVNWLRRVPKADTTALANDAFVRCLKFQSTFTDELQPGTLLLCDDEHPSARLRKAMEDGLFPHQVQKTSRARSAPVPISWD